VKVKSVGQDKSPFPQHFDPSHPSADKNGYVRVPNVNSFVEVMDMREAQRSYSANLQVMQVTRGLLTRAIEMLK
jgi:flagellar basal-body rod protein FlgC